MNLRVVVLVAVGVLAVACSEAAEAGGCYDRPPRPLENAEPVACDEGRYELVAVEDLTALEGEPWPGLSEVSAIAFDRCVDAFTAYVGAAPHESSLHLWFDHPTEGSWADGDRQIVCAATTADGSALQGSVEGSER